MAIEWAFLILLAVGAALADLRPGYIVLVMVVGWILVVLVELLSWRARPRYTVTEPATESMVAEAVPVEIAPPVELPPPTPPEPEPEPEPEPAVQTAVSEPAPPEAAEAPAPTYDFSFGRPAEEKTEVFAGAPAAELDPSHPYAPAPERSRLIEHDQRVVYRLEPLKPRPRRKYGWFGAFLPRERGAAPQGGADVNADREETAEDGKEG
jgi:hypothetical protein